MAVDVAFLTARRISPNKGVDFSTPKLVQINVNQIAKLLVNTKRSGSVIKLLDASLRAAKIEVYENLTQVSAAFDPVAATNPVGGQEVNLAVAAAGAAQGASTALTLYFNKVTSATGGSAEGVILPTAAVGGKPITVINATAVTVKVYPPTGAAIDGGTVNAAVNLLAGARATYVPTALLTYKTAVN